MTPKPASETVQSPAWIAACVAIVGALGFVYFPLLRYCIGSFEHPGEWFNPDYSHAFLVPVFSIYLAWKWKAHAPAEIAWPDVYGLLVILLGSALFAFSSLNIGREWLQGASLVINLSGATLLLGGQASLRWLWPSLAFLLFAFPLPYRIESTLGWELQKIAAVCSEFVLQTVGYATYREGNVLHCKDHVLEVKNACSGLSMLLTFLTLATGMAIVIKRPWLDRIIIVLSAVPIAILSNVVRISLTGILYNEAGKELGDRVFHDFAGWLMMPFALVILLLELKLLDWVLQDDLGKASREDVIRNVTSKPAYLFMPAFEQAEAAKKKAAAAPPPQGSKS